MTESVPRESAGDRLQQLVQAGLSAIPTVGGPAAVLFNMVLKMPIQRRWRAFFEDLFERVAKLEQEGSVRIEDLQQNDEFLSTAMQASQVAVRNHQKEKLDALRNAVLNTAVGQAPDDAKREMFLGFVDVFTVVHLRILKGLSDADDVHSKGIETTIRGITEMAVKLLPDLRESKSLVDIVVEDLCRRGLLFWNREGVVCYTQRGATQVSELGQEFIRFISDPEERA